MALTYAVLCMVSVFVAGATATQLMKWQLFRHRDREIHGVYALIAGTYNGGTTTDLVSTLDAYVQETLGHSWLFIAVGPGGSVLGGNVHALALEIPQGWSSVDGGRLGLNSGTRYRLYSGIVHGKVRLVVGMKFRQLGYMGRLVQTSFEWAFVVAVLLAIVGGSLIAHRMQRRFDAVRETMDRVSRGELGARVPLSGRNDDIERLSEDLNSALDRLADSVESMQQVSADIAHDLKTPLSRLKMTVAEALEKQESALSVADELQSAAAEVDQINRTFDALLRIAQIEAGARKASFKPVDLSDMLELLDEIYREVASDAGQRLLVALPPEGGAGVLGDRELLMQMFSNLIENSIRHCPAGSTIRCSATLYNDSVWVAVTDNGPGIPESEHERVLRRFYRLDKSRTSGGTGLGLSLVKAVADLHDAELRLESVYPGLMVTVIFGRRTPAAA
ncbi:ATP-binding protein [Acidihalobacter prosperus]